MSRDAEVPQDGYALGEAGELAVELASAAAVVFDGCITRFVSCSPFASQRSTDKIKKLQSTSVLQ